MGNSLAVRIFKSATPKTSLKADNFLEIETALGQMQHVSHVPKLSKLIAQITPENRYSEVSTTPEMAKEAVKW